MNDRLPELHTRVQRSRAALESLTDRTARLRARVQEMVTPGHSGPTLTLVEDAGEDGQQVSDAWEIALINEEGK